MSGTCGAPDVEEVVVAAGGQLLPAGRPLEAAHLLLVAPQHACDVLADPTAAFGSYVNPAANAVHAALIQITSLQRILHWVGMWNGC